MMAAMCIALIRFYKLAISPFLTPRCRFDPTCSRYAIDAIGFYGLRRGGWMATKRIFRCHPIKSIGGSWGFDPVHAPTRHCERSEAIQESNCTGLSFLDCRGPKRGLAMTDRGLIIRRHNERTT
ncbi:MAG: membrane protein insertion efficiency factor YidD [Alphaproteobacteria bacterium]